LFLKYLDDLEKDKETAALLSGKTYERIIESKFRWVTWAAPKLNRNPLFTHLAIF
jgi:type I restriction enzyme M protein